MSEFDLIMLVLGGFSICLVALCRTLGARGDRRDQR